jgi:hypothetical protein
MRGQQVNVLNMLIERLLVMFLNFLWIKNLFCSQVGHVFFGDCMYSTRKPKNIQPALEFLEKQPADGFRRFCL